MRVLLHRSAEGLGHSDSRWYRIGRIPLNLNVIPYLQSNKFKDYRTANQMVFRFQVDLIAPCQLRRVILLFILINTFRCGK